jgi:hypothetical protein
MEQLDAVAKLQQLQDLKFTYRLDEASSVPEAVQQLQPLAQLSALQRLTICYNNASLAAASAASWAQLPQLCELQLDFHFEPASGQEWQAIIGGLAAATSLTKLELTAADERLDPFKNWYVVEPAAACGALAGLTRLQDLCIRPESCLMPRDAQALSALTGLTRLVLAELGDGVGDEAAAAIARSCRQLRELDLRNCSLGNATCLAEIAQLTQLTELRLKCNVSVVTEQMLMQLTVLKQLQQLSVDWGL